MSYKLKHKRIPLNSGGGLHYVLPLLAILLVAIVGTYFLVSSQAATKRVDNGKITRRELGFFKAATRIYFQGGESFKKADCQPEEVRVQYYAKKDAEYAEAYKGGAYKRLQIIAQPDWLKTPSKRYCKIYWNTTANVNRPLDSRCITFMHEYGHLLGRDHEEKDTTSVMFAGYANDKISPDKAMRLYETRRTNVNLKSICSLDIYSNKK